MSDTMEKYEEKGKEVIDKISKAAEPIAKGAKKKVKEAEEVVKKTTKTAGRSAKTAGRSTKKAAESASRKATELGKQALELLTPDKATVYVQYLGREFDTKELLALAKEAYIAEGSPAGPVRSINLYVKPEDNAAYYVINDSSTGSILL